MDWSALIDLAVLGQTLVVATPMLLAAQGEVLIERAGVLNVAIEGMMAVGASAGFLAAHASGSNLVGILVAMLAAGIFGWVLAYGAISMRAAQLTLGLALFVFALGASSLMYRLVVGLQFVPPQIETFSGSFWLGLPGPVFAVLLVVLLTHLFLFHTRLGMKVRACGENPRAADLQGVNVFGIRYAMTIAGSMLIGAAGALLPMMLTGTYSDGIVAGRGWIALMLVILGRWLPSGALVGGLIFGYVEALQYSLALTVKSIPSQLLLALPYLFVLVVAVGAYRGAVAPRALMRPYDRESRG